MGWMQIAALDHELLAASSKDADAFAAFYRRHAAAMLTYLRYRTGSVELAADLTADVFAAAFESRRRYRQTGEPARAWLFGIANST
jgi:RNA polymerase sigma-70 factor, ECF subfamily